MKSPGNRSKWVYACFRSEEEKGVALEKLSGLVWKGSKLQTKVYYNVDSLFFFKLPF